MLARSRARRTRRPRAVAAAQRAFGGRGAGVAVPAGEAMTSLRNKTLSTESDFKRSSESRSSTTVRCCARSRASEARRSGARLKGARRLACARARLPPSSARLQHETFWTESGVEFRIESIEH